jgi:hypothetical protein
MIGVFLEPDSVANRTLYLTLFYFKGDQSDFSKDELENAYKFLNGKLKEVAAAATAAAESNDGDEANEHDGQQSSV